MAYIRERLVAEAADMPLVQVVHGSLVIEDTRAELSAVLSDLYRPIARNRLALKLVDRCAADHPEIAGTWFSEGRWAQHQRLVELIEARVTAKRFRRLEDPGVAARTILEMIAFWAMHRHFDPSPRAVDDADAERAVIDFIKHALLEKA